MTTTSTNASGRAMSTRALAALVAVVAVAAAALLGAGPVAARTSPGTVTFRALTSTAGPVGACAGVDAATVAGLTIADAAGEIDELATFSAAVAAAGLGEALSGEGPFTVFAPSNAAFEAIPANVFDSLLADLDLLASILGYHVVTGRAITAEELIAEGGADTLGGRLTVAADGETVLVNGGEAVVTCAGIVTANGVIHVIDGVLQPVADPCAGASSVPGSSAPGSSVPAGSGPDVTAPDVTAPDVTAPDISAPNVTAPAMSAPDISAPDLSGAGSSVPDASTPDPSVPGSGVPIC